MRSASEVLIKPLVTQKSHDQLDRLGAYAFVVARDANKLQIKAAVESQFRVSVLGVRVVMLARQRNRAGVELAGFVDVEVANLTKDFREVTVAWLDEYSRYEAELQMIMGAEFDERRSDRQDLLEGIQKRLLRRVLVTGTAP
jgi:ribosomal protein L23